MPKRSEDPSFFTIIPISVLHDESLSPNAKLLYAEITGLTKQTGYCWAQNRHFANLYKTSERTVIRWIGELQANGHISTHYQYFPNSKKIKERRIYCTFLAKKPSEPPAGSEEKMHIYAENCNLSDAPGNLVVTKMSPLEGLVLTKMSPPNDDKNVVDNNINSNRSSSSDPHGIEKPPGEEEAFEKMDNYSENCPLQNSTEESGPQAGPLPGVSQGKSSDALSLKRFLRHLRPSFVFSEGFYQKAVDFLLSNGLDFNYASWLYEFCVKRKPASIENYFYKVFFDPRCAELFLEEFKPSPVSLFRCPVCSSEHDPSLFSCPSCGLGISHRHDRSEIERKKFYYNMPPDTKNFYDEEAKTILESTGHLPFQERSSRLKSLDRKYGLIDL